MDIWLFETEITHDITNYKWPVYYYNSKSKESYPLKIMIQSTVRWKYWYFVKQYLFILHQILLITYGKCILSQLILACSSSGYQYAIYPQNKQFIKDIMSSYMWIWLLEWVYQSICGMNYRYPDIADTMISHTASSRPSIVIKWCHFRIWWNPIFRNELFCFISESL